MSKAQCFAFLTLLLILLVALFVGSLQVGEMLEYNNGDQIDCGLQSNLTNSTSSEVAYNSSECLNIIATDEGFLWDASLNNITTKNQILVVYGYVDPADNREKLAGEKFDLIYQVSIQGRNNETAEWEIITVSKNETQAVDCKDKEGLQVCSQFLVAHVPLIEYNYYYVKVIIYNGGDIVMDYIHNFHFKVAYIKEEFTKIHFIVRLVFLILSIMVTLIFLCKMCRLNRNATKTYDQKVLQLITISLVFFNDPFFIANLFRPSFLLYIFSQLFTALFFGLLLYYWLRTVEKVKDTQHEDVKKANERRSKGSRGKSPLEIVKTVFFVIFIIDVMVLYVIYMFNVKDDPSYTHFQKVPKAVTGLVIATAILIGIYLIWFAINIFMTLVFFCRISGRSRAMFLLNIFMMLSCAATLILGVYSPFYKDGGVFMFFIGLFNIYIYSLVFLSWPTSLFEEIRIDGDEMGGSSLRSVNNRYEKPGQKGGFQATEESKHGESVVVGTGARDIKIEF